jgi:hypothetical protein
MILLAQHGVHEVHVHVVHVNMHPFTITSMNQQGHPVTLSDHHWSPVIDTGIYMYMYIHWSPQAVMNPSDKVMHLANEAIIHDVTLSDHCWLHTCIVEPVYSGHVTV